MKGSYAKRFALRADLAHFLGWEFKVVCQTHPPAENVSQLWFIKAGAVVNIYHRFSYELVYFIFLAGIEGCLADPPPCWNVCQ